jgi:hypothetical protein
MFAFYVVDEGKTSLLAFNDHDFLVGCGAAAEWVQGLAAVATLRGRA